MKSKFAKLTRNELIIEICAFLLILLFVYTPTVKLMDLKDFRGSISNQPFDNKYTPALMVLLPTFEYLAVVLLFFTRTRLVGFMLSLAMMLAFTIYIGLILSERVYDRVPCSCGGIMQELSWTQHLFVNLFFILVSALGIFLMTRKPKNPKAESISDNPVFVSL